MRNNLKKNLPSDPFHFLMFARFGKKQKKYSRDVSCLLSQWKASPKKKEKNAFALLNFNCTSSSFFIKLKK